MQRCGMKAAKYVMQVPPRAEGEYLGWWVCSDGVTYGPFTRQEAEEVARHWTDELGCTTWLEEV